jgi:hypothetical protein
MATASQNFFSIMVAVPKSHLEQAKEKLAQVGEDRGAAKIFVTFTPKAMEDVLSNFAALLLYLPSDADRDFVLSANELIKSADGRANFMVIHEDTSCPFERMIEESNLIVANA